MLKFAKRKDVPEFPLERLLKCYNASGAFFFGVRLPIDPNCRIMLPHNTMRCKDYAYRGLSISLYSNKAIIRYGWEDIYSSFENKGFFPDVPDDVRIKTIELINEFCEEVERKTEEYKIAKNERREKAFKDFLEDKCPSLKP
jgi:hypothetical protein